MSNILKANQSTPTSTWCHRKTIQSQAAEIETLRNKSDALLKLTHEQEAEKTFLKNKIKCLCGIIANHVDYEQYLEDEFFNLGDACMNRLAGLESPFQYE